MALKFAEGLGRKKAELDMAPLIDVVFLLLVFFLLTSSYVFKAFDLKMPAKAKVRPEQKDELPPVTISILDDESILFDGIPILFDDLARNVHAHLPPGGDRTFVLKTSDESEVSTLINVMERVRSTGAKDVRLARRPKPEEESNAGD